MMVGGQLYPLASGDLEAMEDSLLQRRHEGPSRSPAEEEAISLADMPGVLGAKAMAALEAVQDALGLDYGGIDFGLNQQWRDSAL